MTSQNRIENQNFWKLIFGQSLFTIGDAIFQVVLLFTLAQQYHASSSILGIFGILALLPSLLLATLVPKVATIKNQKLFLIFLQIFAVAFLAIEILLILSKSSLVYIGIFQFLLQFAATISGTVEIGYIPVILYNDQNEIDKTVNISYVTDSLLVILTGVISSGVMMAFGTLILLIFSIALPLIGIIFYLAIDYKEPKQQIDLKSHPAPKSQSYIALFKDKFYTYTHTLPAFLIIISEAIIGGLTGLLLQLLPITMKELGLAVALFPLVSSVQKTGDVVGGFLAPFVKLNTHKFFIIDYLVTGVSFIIIGLPGVPDVCRLAVLLISALTAGLSGNIFEKLMYRSFEPENMSSMHALVTSTFSFCSLISYFNSFFKISTLYLWIGTGIFSIFVGLSLFLYSRTHPQTIAKLNME